jgi:hypothetical protein
MSGNQSHERMLRAALKYASVGWHVFPLAEHEDVKAPHPMLGKKDAHRLATTDEDQIRAWWGARPDAGIGCWLKASGLIAVDVDPRDGGDAALLALEARYGALTTTVIGLTGGNGFHHLFKAGPDLSPPGKIHRTKGLDIKYNGYIVLPPSIHASKHQDADGKMSYVKSPRRYRWKDGADPFRHINDIPELPAWVLERDTPVAVNGYNLNGHTLNGHEVDVFAEDTPRVGLTTEQIREVLAKIPNEGMSELDYEDWQQVLCGVFHETDGSPDGRDLAYEWSSRALKHTDAEFDKTWPSLKIDGKGQAPTTFRFALKLAKENADRDAAEAMREIRTALAAATTMTEALKVCETVKRTEMPDIYRISLTQAVQRLHATVDDFPKLTIGEARKMTRHATEASISAPLWLEGWTYVAEDASFYHSKRGAISKVAFDDTFNAEMLTRRDKLEGRGVPELTASNAALNLYEIPKVDGRRYSPESPEIFEINGATFLNTYHETEQPEVPDTPTAEDQENTAIVEAHFAHLIPDRRTRETILSWLAYIVQTRKRPTWAIMLQGPEGDGKSFIVNLMAVVLGPSNVGVVDVSILESAFNGWAEGHLLKSVEELKMHGHSRYDTLNKLKQVITNATIPIHRKNRDPYTAMNTAGYLITTNFRDALPISDQDSRYYMHASPRQTREEVAAFEAANPGYFPALFGTLDDSPGALRKWMLEYPIADHFRPYGRAPASIEHDHAVALNKSDEQTAIEDAMATGGVGLSADLLDTTALAGYFLDHGMNELRTNSLRSLLTTMGFHFLGRFKVEGSNRRFWSRAPAKFGKAEAVRARKIREWLSADDL